MGHVRYWTNFLAVDAMRPKQLGDSWGFPALYAS
jgi:hypothetical protein